MKKIILIFLTVILAVACHTTKPSKILVTTVETAKDLPTDSLAAVNRKKNLYEQHCMSCHDLAKPSSETEREWRKIVPRMAAMINKNGIVVDSKMEEDILSYLILNCKK